MTFLTLCNLLQFGLKMNSVNTESLNCSSGCKLRRNDSCGLTPFDSGALKGAFFENTNLLKGVECVCLIYTDYPVILVLLVLNQKK